MLRVVSRLYDDGKKTLIVHGEEVTPCTMVSDTIEEGQSKTDFLKGVLSNHEDCVILVPRFISSILPELTQDTDKIANEYLDYYGITETPVPDIVINLRTSPGSIIVYDKKDIILEKCGEKHKTLGSSNLWKNIEVVGSGPLKTDLSETAEKITDLIYYN